LGNTTSQTSRDTGNASATYYDDGLLKSRTDAQGRTFSYVYDGIGRPTSITYGSGTPSGFEYDGGPGAANPNNSIGKLSKLTDEAGTTEYGHDGLGRVNSKKQTVGAAKRAFTLTQKWGDSGTQASKIEYMNYPGQIRVNYQYDETGRVKKITLNPAMADGTRPDLTQTIPLVSDMVYTPLSAVESWTWGGGVAYKRSYDTQGRLKTYPLGNPQGTGAAAGIKRTVNYDDAGRISGFTHTNANYDQSYTHDGLDRLKQQQQLGTTYDYGYDLNGNRKSVAVNGTPYVNTVDTDSNRLLKENQPNTAETSLAYNLAGDLKTATTNSVITKYNHGPRGRLSSIDLPGAGTVSYLYNGLEQRLVKTGAVQGGARYYMYDEAGHTIGEYDKDGHPVYEVVYLGDTPVAAITQVRTTDGNGVTTVQTKVSYIYADHLDTPRVIARASDHFIQWRWDQSEAYGNTPANQNPNALGKYDFNLRFPGQLFDQESNLVYNWYRYYDASTGRYVESDPLGLNAGDNTYAYVGATPLDALDPDGRWKILAGALVGAGIDIAIQYYIDGKSLRCLNLYSVMASAGMGAVSPGFIGMGANYFRIRPALNALRPQLAAARTANRMSKIERRINAHLEPLKVDLMIKGMVMAVGGSAKALTKDITWTIGDDCECQARSSTADQFRNTWHEVIVPAWDFMVYPRPH
jgi:RHS repeat-associated protein